MATLDEREFSPTLTESRIRVSFPIPARRSGLVPRFSALFLQETALRRNEKRALDTRKRNHRESLAETSMKDPSSRPNSASSRSILHDPSPRVEGRNCFGFPSPRRTNCSICTRYPPRKGSGTRKGDPRQTCNRIHLGVCLRLPGNLVTINRLER